MQWCYRMREYSISLEICIGAYWTTGGGGGGFAGGPLLDVDALQVPVFHHPVSSCSHPSLDLLAMNACQPEWSVRFDTVLWAGDCRASKTMLWGFCWCLLLHPVVCPCPGLPPAGHRNTRLDATICRGRCHGVLPPVPATLVAPSRLIVHAINLYVLWVGRGGVGGSSGLGRGRAGV